MLCLGKAIGLSFFCHFLVIHLENFAEFCKFQRFFIFRIRIEIFKILFALLNFGQFSLFFGNLNFKKKGLFYAIFPRSLRVHP